MSDSTSPLLRGKKIGILGTGNMGQTLIRAIVESGVVEAHQIYASNRSYKKLAKVVEKWGVNEVKDPEDLTDLCDVIFLATKPQDIWEAIEPFNMEFLSHHTVISLAAGITLESLSKFLPNVHSIARVMPNTPSRIRRGVVGYCVSDGAEASADLIEDLLGPLGFVVRLEEGEAYEAFTVAAASGPGFLFELMQIWQEWLEDYDFSPEESRRIVAETFSGTAELAKRDPTVSFNDLQGQVTSKGGVTFAGLESMREMELDRLIRVSFEKAVLRDRELGQKLKNR
jgi:pyrroline-5-carboxylate reductase